MTDEINLITEKLNNKDKTPPYIITKGLKNNKRTPADSLLEQKVENLKADRALKKSYAKWFFVILVVQIVIMNVVFILVGCKLLDFQGWSLNLYMTGTLAEVFGVIFVITKNLFPNKNK